MHRPSIGLSAVLLLTIGYFTREQPDETISSACTRAGLIMAVLWFAQPQLKNVPRWLIITSGIVLFFVMRRPILLAWAVPLIVVLWFLRPRAPGVRPRFRKDA